VETFLTKPYLLINKIQPYAWGTKNEQAFIPKLLGMEPEPNKPYAELWMGMHPKAPSLVRTSRGDVPLGDFVRSYPNEVLGERVVQQFGTQLPFLFKVLSAAEALSIQAHPDKEQAVRLHARDPEHYPDDNHKPEIAIALDELIALVGFCPVDALLQTLATYPEIRGFVGAKRVETLAAARKGEQKEALRLLFATLMNRGDDEPQALEHTLTELEKRLRHQKTLSEKEVLFLELRSKYGTDIGLLVIFFLNLLHLKKGQGVFLKAGVPHAYIRGNIVECMANSDNVVRAGLTPKFKDIKTLVEILTYEAAEVDVFTPPRNREFVYRVPVSEFSIAHWQLTQNEKIEHRVDSVEILLAIEGAFLLRYGNDAALPLKKGESLLIPAALQNYSLQALDEGEAFCAFVP